MIAASGRLPGRGVGRVALAGAALLLGWAARANAESAVQIVTQTDREVIFELRTERPELRATEIDGRSYVSVVMPGMGNPRGGGEPDLPAREVLIALPPGAEGAAELLQSDAVPLGRARPLPVPVQNILLPQGADAVPDLSLDYREDAVVYGGAESFPARAVETDASRAWRHYRVLPVRVTPLRYDPAAGTLIWFPRVRVRVVFLRSATPGLRSGTSAYTAPEPRWEPLFRDAILNYESAAGYRTRPAARALPQGAGLPAGAQEWRVAVDTTGVYRVRFSDLAAAGIETSDLDWADLKLVVRDYDDAAPDDPQREYPIALRAEDTNGDGRFAEGESLVFYGEDAWDFFDLAPGDKRYGRRNVYWLVAGGGPGQAMAERAPWYGWTGLPPRASYERTIHYEKNIYYMEICAAGDEPGPASGPFGVRTDHYNWTYRTPNEAGVWTWIKTVRLDLPTVVSLSRVRVHLQGQNYPKGSTSSFHMPRLWLSRSGVPGDTTWAFPGNPYSVATLSDLTVGVENTQVPPSTALGTGRNYLKIYVPLEGDHIDDRDADQVGIDWAEVTFRGSFEVRAHRLFAPLDGLTGRVQLLVRRVPSRDVRVFDVGDPRAPIAIPVADSLFAPASGGFDLRLQVDAGDGSRPVRILLVEGSAFDPLPPKAITRRTELPLTQFSGEDLIVAYPRRFGPELEPLLAHREAQGHRVLRAPMDAVYDTYSGGRAHPFALKRLLRAVWRESTPSPDYLFLLGDASNDLAGYGLGVHVQPSDSVFVPTITFGGHAFQGTGTEMVSFDEWFVDDLDGVWGAPLTRMPYLNVGRVSAGNPEETRAYVEKALAYEQNDPTASWRNRIVALADDDFSSTLSGLGSDQPYLRQYAERYFLDITRRAMDYVLGDTLFSHFVVDSVYLNALMDSVVTLGRCVPDTLDPSRCQRDLQGNLVRVGYGTRLDFGANWGYGETEVKRVLMDALNRGALYWAYQGHSNRAQLTHERVFLNSWAVGRLDPLDLANVGKPFLFGGYGCHLDDFASFWEGDRNRRDAMTEIMVNCCPGSPRGAIGAIGSTDYETIGHTYEEKVSSAFFEDPPADSLGQRRWRLGELFTRSKMKLGTTELPRLTYMLLGDPALRMGVMPPWVRLVLNGRDWELGGPLDYGSDRDDDSLIVRIRLTDESSVTPPAVEDWFGAAAAESVRVLSRSREGRILEALYRTRIERRPYSLKVSATDYEGSVREVEVRVPFAIQLYEQIGDGLEPLPPDGVIGPEARLALTARTGAHLGAEDLRLMAGGLAVPVERAEVETDPGQPSVWTVRFAALPAAPEGGIALEAQTRQRDGAWLTLASQSVTVGKPGLRIAEAEWMPNPFGDRSHLVYRLTDDAVRTRLRIFTASGRKILDDAALPAAHGTRYFLWDGRDADGDPVANGLYFYELTLWDRDGKRADRVLDKLVRAR
jgi:hypothetical protein